MIVIAPLGMKHTLAVKLVEDPDFAHTWLCHNGNAHECTDGCEGGCTSGNMDLRTKLYNDIRVYQHEPELSAYKRGYEDAVKGRSPLFRRVGKEFVANAGDDWAWDMSEEWCQDKRQAYMDGYDRGEFHTH